MRCQNRKWRAVLSYGRIADTVVCSGLHKVWSQISDGVSAMVMASCIHITLLSTVIATAFCDNNLQIPVLFKCWWWSRYTSAVFPLHHCTGVARRVSAPRIIMTSMLTSAIHDQNCWSANRPPTLCNNQTFYKRFDTFRNRSSPLPNTPKRQHGSSRSSYEEGPPQEGLQHGPAYA